MNNTPATPPPGEPPASSSNSSSAADSAPLGLAFVLLAAAGFTSMASMRICDAMLPLLAQQFGTDTSHTAVVISAFAITYGALQLFYGPLGDRLGKMRVVGLATVLCAAGSLAAALAPGLGALTAARVLMGAGAAGIVPLALAWIGDQVPFAQRQEVLARYMGATVLGMMVGAWVGGLFAQSLGWRWAFAALALLFMAVSLVLWRTRAQHEAQRSAGAAAAAAQRPYLERVRELLRSPWARRVMTTVMAEGALVFGTMAMVPTVLHARFGLPLAQGGAVLATFGAGGLLYSRTAGPLLRRLGAAGLAAFGSTLFAVGLALLAAAPHWAWSVPACALAGLGFYSLHNTLQLNATQLSSDSRGLAVSLFACALFIGQSVGVTAAAQVFTQGPVAWAHGAVALGTAALGWDFARQLRQRHGAMAPT